MRLTFAFCTYNRADRLDRLVTQMRAQSCPIPFEILAVNNNSGDDTAERLEALAQQPGAPLRWVTESKQGIVSARNRALEESLDSDIMVFIDDDELPMPGLLEAATHAIQEEGAQCAGGRVRMDFSTHTRPAWLGDELLGFLAALDYGEAPFWIENRATPIWTANIAYDMSLFRNDPSLRFDKRYDRQGQDIGGGEDAIMFRAFLDRGVRIRYRPDMVTLHAVEAWRLTRSYFLKLHYRKGLRQGQYELPTYERKILGVPPFMVMQFLRHSTSALGMHLSGRAGALRQGMNAAHSLGNLVGYRHRGAVRADELAK